MLTAMDLTAFFDDPSCGVGHVRKPVTATAVKARDHLRDVELCRRHRHEVAPILRSGHDPKPPVKRCLCPLDVAAHLSGSAALFADDANHGARHG